MTLHTNSMTAYPEVDQFNRRGKIMDTYRAHQEPLTDRQVMKALGYQDLNAVRPRITELIEDGHLEEAGSVKDEVTGRMVRKVRLVFKAAMFTMLLVIAALANARAQEPQDEQIVNAIYLAEGGSRATYAYGIRSIKYSSIAEARQICLNSVRNNRKRWEKAGRPGDFLEFMSRRYCPIGCDNDRGTNKFWVKNVKYYLQRGA